MATPSSPVSMHSMSRRTRSPYPPFAQATIAWAHGPHPPHPESYIWITVGMRGSVATAAGFVKECRVIFSEAARSSGNAPIGRKVMSGAVMSSGFMDRGRAPGRLRSSDAAVAELPLAAPRVAMPTRRRMATAWISACSLWRQKWHPGGRGILASYMCMHMHMCVYISLTYRLPVASLQLPLSLARAACAVPLVLKYSELQLREAQWRRSSLG